MGPICENKFVDMANIIMKMLVLIAARIEILKMILLPVLIYYRIKLRHVPDRIQVGVGGNMVKLIKVL